MIKTDELESKFFFHVPFVFLEFQGKQKDLRAYSTMVEFENRQKSNLFQYNIQIVRLEVWDARNLLAQMVGSKLHQASKAFPFLDKLKNMTFCGQGRQCAPKWVCDNFVSDYTQRKPTQSEPKHSQTDPVQTIHIYPGNDFVKRRHPENRRLGRVSFKKILGFTA